MPLLFSCLLSMFKVDHIFRHISLTQRCASWVSYNVLLNKTGRKFLSLWVKQKQQIHGWNGKRHRGTSNLSREWHIWTCGSWKASWNTCMVCVRCVYSQQEAGFHLLCLRAKVTIVSRLAEAQRRALAPIWASDTSRNTLIYNKSTHDNSCNNC